MEESPYFLSESGVIEICCCKGKQRNLKIRIHNQEREGLENEFGFKKSNSLSRFICTMFSILDSLGDSFKIDFIAFECGRSLNIPSVVYPYLFGENSRFSLVVRLSVPQEPMFGAGLGDPQMTFL